MMEGEPESGAKDADQRQPQRRGERPDGVVWSIDELAAGFGVDAVGVADGVHAPAQSMARLDDVHGRASPGEIEGGAQAGEPAADHDDTGRVTHDGRLPERPVRRCVRRWEPRRTGRPDRSGET